MTRFFRAPKHSAFVLGNSRAVNSVDEKFAQDSLHVDILNLGFNGMPYADIYTFVNEVNNANSNSTLFVEISGLVNNENDNSYAYYISNSNDLKKRYAGTVFNVLPLLRLNNEIFIRNIYYLSKSDNDWVNRNRISSALVEDISKDTTKMYLFPKKNELLKRMEGINEMSVKKGNRVVFFLAPYYPEYLNKAQDYESVCKEIRALSGIEFYDLNELHLPLSAYADRLHTNVDGATILTRFLLEKKEKIIH